MFSSLRWTTCATITSKMSARNSRIVGKSIQSTLRTCQFCLPVTAPYQETHQKNKANVKRANSIIIGKTKVMAKALGSSVEDEPLPNLSSLHNLMHGHVGLLFTSRSPASIRDFFDSYSRMSFARTGAVASQEVTIPAGQVYSRAGQIAVEDDVPLPAAMETSVRKWTLPTRLEKGKVMLDNDYTICKAGDQLNNHQTALLKTFGIELAEFAIRIKGYSNCFYCCDLLQIFMQLFLLTLLALHCVRFYDASSHEVTILDERSEAQDAVMSS